MPCPQLATRQRCPQLGDSGMAAWEGKEDAAGTSSRLVYCWCTQLITLAMWASLIALGIAAVFSFNVREGWKTGEVRLPISVLIFEEFERAKSPENYWGIMAFNGIVALTALGVAFWSLWTAVS